MDVRYFLNILWKRKFLILTVVAVAAILTFLAASRLPDKYRSNAILTTGIVEFKGVSVEKENPFIQQFQVENAFSNLIEGIMSRSTIKKLTERLLEHDLAKSHGNQPFRLFTSNKENFSMEDLKKFSEGVPAETDSLQTDSNPDLEQEKSKLFNKIANALHYDYESLKKNLEVKRIPETDYLSIDFASENPELSHFVVKSFVDEVIKLDRSVQVSEENSAVSFYSELVKEKKKSLDELLKEQSDYQSNRTLVNLEEQTKSIVSQLRELEVLREQIKKDIPGLQSNIQQIDKILGRTTRDKADKYANEVFSKTEVKELDGKINLLNDQYIATGLKDENLKSRLEKLKDEKRSLTKKNTSTLAYRKGESLDPNEKRTQDLIDNKIDKELELSTAEASVNSLDKEIGKLRSKAKSLVSDNSYIGNLDQQIEIARKEYFDLVDKLHQAEQVSKKPDSRLGILENATFPEKPEPSKKVLLSAFAGVASGILTIVILFVLAFFDSTLSSPFKFRNSTKMPLVGAVNRLKIKNLDFNQVFGGAVQDKHFNYFLESMRKIRYAIETSGATTFLVTSTKQKEGKSFFMLALAYSLSLNNRRILLIDTNFRNNSLSELSNLPSSEALFTQPAHHQPPRKKTVYSLPALRGYLPKNMDVLGNYGGNFSPAEAIGGRDFVKILYEFSQQYDYILMEGPALNDYADSRELALYADKVLAVYGAASKMTEADKESNGFLKSLGEKYLGGVLNSLERDDS